MSPVPAPKPRRRRWRRVLVWTAVAVVVARLLLALLLPWLLGLAAGAAGLALECRSARLSLTGGWLRLEDVVARDPAAPASAPPLFQAHELHADLATLQLFGGELVVVDAALVGAQVHLRRDADGSLLLPSAWTASAPPTAADEADGDDADAATPWRFDLPLQATSVRVHDLRLVVDDVATGARQELALDLDVADLGRRDGPGSVLARLHGPEHFDDLWFAATLATTERELRATWQASLRGVRAGPLPWLDTPVGPTLPHVVQIECEGELRASGADAPTPLPQLEAHVGVRVLLDERERLAIDVAAGPSQGADDAWRLPFSVQAQGADLVERVALADGRFDVTPNGAQAAARLELTGATLALLRPWLAGRGVTLPEAGLTAAATLAGEVRDGALSATLTDLRVGDDDAAVRLASCALRGVRVEPTGVRIAALEIDGPTVPLAIAADGGLACAGLRLGTPAEPTGATGDRAPAATATTTPFVWPRVQLDGFEWRGLRLDVADASLPTPAALAATIDLRGAGLVVGRAAEPGRLVATVTLPDAIGELRADVTSRPEDDALAVECEVRGDGITAQALAPWLARAGIEPTLTQGRLRARAAVRVGAGATPSWSARLADVRFEDGDEVLFSLRRLEGQSGAAAAGANDPAPIDASSGARADATALDLGTWTLDQPFVAVQRRTDGNLSLLGLALGAAEPPSTSDGAPAAAAPPAPERTAPPSPTTLRHGELTLQRAVVQWRDARRPELAAVSLGLDLSLAPASGTGDRAALQGELRLDPGAGAIALAGELRRDRASGSLTLALTGDDLRGAPLRPLLPDGTVCTLQDGDLLATVDARWGGAQTSALAVTVRDLALRDGETELFALDRLELDAPALTATRVHLAAVRVQGLRAVAAKSDEAVHLPGFRVAPAAAAPVAAAPPASPTPGHVPPPPVPQLRLDALDVGIERLVVRERGATDGEPVVLSARLRLVEPWASADDVAATPPCTFELTAAAPPLLGAATTRVDLQPFALEPGAVVSLRASGIDTTALPRVLPSLAAALDGTMTDGTFAADLHLQLGLRRRDPRVFDLGSAFGLDLAIENVDLRAAPDGPSLMRVEEVHVDARAIDPGTGDVLLRSVEIDRPSLSVANGPDGLDVAGLRLKPPPAGADTAPTSPPSAPPAAVPPATPATPPEFAVDRLQVFGLAVELIDTSTTPPTRLPLQDSDLKLRNFSTRAFTEPRELAFAATLRGGPVELEQRVLRSSVLAGVLGSAAGMLTGADDRHATETRPLVDEIVVRAELQPFPAPKGQVRVEVHGFELPAVRGLARPSGVEIGDGVFDLELEAALRGARGADLRLRPKFTWLSLSEPPGGPLSTYLKLPAPLDAVLFALKNDDDEHVLPLRLEVPAGGGGPSRVADAAVGALSRLIADAVASAAFRVTGAVTGAVGLGGGGNDLRQLAGALTFAPGDPQPAAGTLDEVLTAAAADPELVIVLHHELGAADLDRARELALPPAEIVAATVNRLRAERADLERQRAAAAGRLAALYAAGRMQDAWQGQAALARLDQRLGEVVATLEDALLLAAGESERARRLRTRAAALELAERRLASVRRQVQDRLGGAADRVEWRTPRGVVTAGLDGGGRVAATLRRRALR